MSTSAELVRWEPRAGLRRRHVDRRFLALIGVLAAAILAMPLVAVAQVQRMARVDDLTHTDAILVLGAAQYQGTPSPVLANRLEHARALFDAGIADTIVTVGGFNTGDVTSEAQAGKEALVAEGLERSQIIAVPFGASTAESVEAVATISVPEGIHSVTVVTDPAHVARASALLTAAGLQPHPAPTQRGPGTKLGARYVVKEAAGLMAVWLDW